MDIEFFTADRKDIGMVEMAPRHRSDAIGAEELVFVQHSTEHPAILVFVHQTKQPSSAEPIFLEGLERDRSG